MAQARGSAAQIIFDEETTYGSDPGSPDAYNCPFVSDSLGATQNFLMRETLTSSRQKKAPVLGNVDVAGDINVELNNHHHAYLLKHLMGSVSTTGSDPYDHEMKGGTLPTSLVIEKGFTDITEYLKYNGCRISRATFNFPQEGIVTATFGIVGAQRTRSGTSFDATPTTDTDLVFDGFDGAIEEGGGAIAYVTSCVIEIDNELDVDSGFAYGGSGIRTTLPEGMHVVTGTLNARYESETLLNKAINSTETSLEITLTRDANNVITFFIPEMIYSPADPNVTSSGGIILNLPFQGYYDDNSDAAALVITVKNDIATL